MIITATKDKQMTTPEPAPEDDEFRPVWDQGPDMCWAYGHETDDEPVCIYCGQPIVGP